MPTSPPLDLTSLQHALASLRRGLIRWQGSGMQDEDLPDAHSVDAMSFRELMRSGGERGLVQDVDAWMEFRDKRNTKSHTYNAAKASEVAAVIPRFADHAQALLAQLQARGAQDA